VEIAFFALTPFIAVALIGRAGFLVTLVALPLAIMVIVCAMRSRGASLNRCLGMAGALQWAFGILFVIGSMI
jgi:hypothetical protein